MKEKLNNFSNNFNRVQTELERCKLEFNNKTEINLNEMREKDKLLKEKDDKINQLSKEIEEIKFNTDKIYNYDKF